MSLAYLLQQVGLFPFPYALWDTSPGQGSRGALASPALGVVCSVSCSRKEREGVLGKAPPPLRCDDLLMLSAQSERCALEDTRDI